MKNITIGIICLLGLVSCYRIVEVQDSAGNPIEGATVYQLHYSMSESPTKSTSSRGRVIVSRFPGTERLRVCKPGYYAYHEDGASEIPRTIVLSEVPSELKSKSNVPCAKSLEELMGPVETPEADDGVPIDTDEPIEVPNVGGSKPQVDERAPSNAGSENEKR